MLHHIFCKLICIFFPFLMFAGKSTINDEEGGNSDAKSQVVIEVEEEERRWRLSSHGTFG